MSRDDYSSAVTAVCFGMILALMMGLCTFGGSGNARPLIRDVSVRTFDSMDGPVIVYRYSVGGIDSVVELSGDGALAEYREYLSRFGRFDR
jgi:hypothetical protein